MSEFSDTSFSFDDAVSALHDTNPEIRYRAVNAIGRLRQKRSVELLLGVLEDADPNVKLRAILNLQYYMDETIMPKVLDYLQRAHVPDDVLAGSLIILGSSKNPAAYTPLRFSLNHASWLVRGHAASALGELRDPRAVEPLLALLNDNNPDLYPIIINALSKIGDARAFAPLLDALEKSDSPVLRMYAAFGLGRIGSSDAIQPLFAALGDNHGTVANAAIEALAMIGGQDVIALLLSAFRDENRLTYIREVIASTLGRFGDPVITQTLTTALHDPLEDIRIGAAIGLAYQGDRIGVDILLSTVTNPNSWTDDIIRTFDALKSLNLQKSIALPVLFRFLGNTTKEIRIIGVETLREIGSEEAIEPLVSLFEAEDNETRAAIIQALTQIGTSPALAAMQKLQ